MQNVTLAGFVVVDGKGEFLSWAEHIETAMLRSREMEEARQIFRCSDNALIGWKAGKSVRQVVR